MRVATGGLCDQNSVNTGIVLQSVPEKYRIIIFDRIRGKIEGTCFTKLSSGVSFLYRKETRGSRYTIVVKELLFAPLIQEYRYILFIHALLEVCMVVAPYESSMPHLFDLLLYVCTNVYQSFSEYQYYLVSAKLFSMLGLHTNYVSLCGSCLTLIHGASVDTIGFIALDSKCAEKVQSWLYYCLTEHVSEQCLKTQTFFKKDGI